ncbi:hypothetical protein KS4_31390 [Poriferisphaera corsica]|uniref:DUF1015 domain-containing protein n=1 Tax=Poriferisphaera corsica TaxID=2528020 RepID=A0A517YXW3_9BACT|nr:DUF1015 domain-containing protein [Poriferisphaera corsica]QDU35061.1 hypothetical protein KS4_31390 [Poriferisphaera corsica]
MPLLQPIKALTYSIGSGEDISDLIAPPYDVLDEGPKQQLLSQSPNNIVAVDLPVTPPKTVGPDEKYNDAANLFKQWIDAGILKQSPKPAIYLYEQQYTAQGKSHARRGMFAALKLEEFNQSNGIFRHEMTIQGGLDDRYKLMNATQSQLSPIFGVYSDSQKQVADQLESIYTTNPSFTGTTENDNVLHRVWIVDDESLIDSLQSFFKTAPVYIADGHHRYTTALNYHKNNPNNPDASTCLFVLVAAEDPGMIVLPTHRVITGMTDFSIEKFLTIAAKRSDIIVHATKHSPDELAELENTLPGAGNHAMALYDPQTKTTYTISTTSPDPLANITPDKPEVWRTLDVAILQHLLVEEILKPNFATNPDDVGYKYTADINDFRNLTEQTDDNDQPRLGIIVQYTPLQSVMGVSLADEVMPAKSTYFFPKLATGLVINPLTPLD